MCVSYAREAEKADAGIEQIVPQRDLRSIEVDFAAQMARKREEVASQQRIAIDLDGLMARMRGFLIAPNK